MNSTYYINIVIGIMLLAGFFIVFYDIFKMKASLNWKITRGIMIVFLVLFCWSLFRLVNKTEIANRYDFLILFFNFGLLVIGFITSRNIKL